MAVVDLGQQNLKDVQHERIFQLALEGDESFPPLKTETPKSSSDALAERIERHVEEMIEQSLHRSRRSRRRSRARRPQEGLRWTAIGLIELLLVVLTILVIIWLIRKIL